MPQLFAGTSGFAFSQWKPVFYPKDIPAKKFLEYYSRRLNSVEINYTFRRLPAASTLQNWIQATPKNFAFVLKAHQRITHLQRLQGAAEFTELFLHSVAPLQSNAKLGPILFQLPPYFRSDAEVLANFLALLPPEFRYAFEFRHPSWLNDSVYELLEKRNVALCLAESEKLEIPEVITADFVYFRLRKPEYAAKDRKRIGEKAERFLAQGKDVYLFFKHEDTPQGAFHAEELLERLGKAKK